MVTTLFEFHDSRIALKLCFDSDVLNVSGQLDDPIFHVKIKRVPLGNQHKHRKTGDDMG